MILRATYINSFTSEHFRGNPAAVIVLDREIDASTLQNVAAQTALPETAYLTIKEDTSINIRWFTPDIEMDLCGHATLAAAAYYFKYINSEKDYVIFQSVSGELRIEREGEQLKMFFPIRRAIEASLPENIYNSLNIKPSQVLKSRDYLLVFDNEKQIRDIEIDRSEFDKINLDPGGVVITAPGERVDFVSRFFTPQSTIFEDPVTGSAHCSLVPYWAQRLGKERLKAWQLSERGGELLCTLTQEYVELKGDATFESEKEIII